MSTVMKRSAEARAEQHWEDGVEDRRGRGSSSAAMPAALSALADSDTVAQVPPGCVRTSAAATGGRHGNR